MLQAARQLEPATGPDDWVPIELAAELTGASDRQWRRKATFEAASAAQVGRRSLAEKRPSRTSNGRLSWYVHRSMHPLLRAVPAKDVRDDRARASLLTRFAEHAIVLAYKRAHWLHRWQGGCRRMHGRGATALELAKSIVREARHTEDDTFTISVRTLQRWGELYNALSPDGKQVRGVEALIDGRSPANRTSEGETDVYAAQRSPEAIECFYRLYHTESKNPIVVCHEHVVREAEKHGWSWPASYSATRRWLERYDRRDVTYMNRYGLSAFTKKYMPYNDIDYSLIQPGDLFTTDHHECDWWCQGDGGKQFRPWLTVVQDNRSRSVVGWHLGEAPHADAIVAAYLMAFRDWAIPNVLRIDNGKDFCSERLTGCTKATRNRLRREHGRDWQRVIRRDANLVECNADPRFSGITNELNIETIYAIPYAAWSKGTTERLFGTLESRCGKTFATYCGNSTLGRPECLEVIRNGYTKATKKTLRKRHGREWKKIAVLRLSDTSDVPTISAARQAVGEWITEYHHTKHSAEDMAGMTPLEMWRTAKSLRRADAEALLFLMQSQGIYRVGPNGVRFKSFGTVLKYGAGNPCLYRHIGRDVFITIDPNDLSACYAFTPDRNDRRCVGKLDANERISPLATADELREANAAVNRRRKLMRSAASNSPNRTRTAAQELAAQRRERVAELRATGTDAQDHTPNIVPVETGFENAARDAKAAATRPARTDRPRRKHADVAQAMHFGRQSPTTKRARPRPTLALLANTQTVSPEDDGDGNQGKEAESSADILSLIGDRHGRTKE